MARFNLTRRIALVAGMALVTGGVASGFLVWQLYSTSAVYDRMLGQAEVQHQDRARVMQGEFKTDQANLAQEAAAVPEPARRLLADVRDTEARAAQQASVASQIRNSLISVAVMFIAIALGVVLVIRRTRSEMVVLTRQLTQAAQGTASASGQVSTAAQSLSQGASEQAASLEEASAAIEEMASMTRQNAEHSQMAAALMGEVDARVQGSNQALGEMVTSMASIQESSQQVAKIIKTIDEIAFQTNILALNAAVEAARAGEAGMGFAVVADEVRNLAQRSARAARDTAAMIEESIAKAQRGNLKVEQVAGAIAGITASVSKVKILVDEVSRASRQQSQGIGQVSQAMAQMEKVTQATAATAAESAAASEELNAQAEGSMQVVDRLEALVGTSGAAALVAATAPNAKGSVARVLRMPAGAKAATPVATAEDLLPMDDTGTFGKF